MILEEDLNLIAQDIKKNNIKNCTILISGATGLIGSLLVKGFLNANEKYNLNNHVLALALNLQKAQLIFERYKDNPNLTLIENEITQQINYSANVDYIFHTAAITKSQIMISSPVELIKTTVVGSLNIFDFAIKRKAKSVVYLSSIEAFGVINNKESLKENDLGYLDLQNVRNCYPESKRLVENLCACYAKQYGLNVKVARLTQTFGAGASFNDSRIFGEIARSIIEKKDIVLKTSGNTTHDYCYTTDTISALLTIATKGTCGEVYNVANPDTNMSIKDMAKLVAISFGNNKVKVIQSSNNQPATCYSPENKISLNVDKLLKLNWKPKYNLKQIYERLIQSYRDILEGNSK